MAATKTSKPAAPSPAGVAPKPVALICGDDDFAVKQRARVLFRQWSEELGGMDHETIDARVNTVDEALKALAKLREALNTLPFFGGAKVLMFPLRRRHSFELQSSPNAGDRQPDHPASY